MKITLKALLISTLVFCWASIPVLASEKQLEIKPDITAKSQEMYSAAAISTITAPDGKTYTLLGTLKRGSTLRASFQSTVRASDTIQLKFYCPNNDRKDLVQGTVTTIPVLSGTSKTYSFTNIYNPLSTIDLPTLSGITSYRITITINATGTSNQGTVYFRTDKNYQVFHYI